MQSNDAGVVPLDEFQRIETGCDEMADVEVDSDVLRHALAGDVEVFRTRELVGGEVGIPERPRFLDS